MLAGGLNHGGWSHLGVSSYTCLPADVQSTEHPHRAPLHGLHLLTAWHSGQSPVPSVVPLGPRTESQHTEPCCSSWLSSEAKWRPLPAFCWQEAAEPLRFEGRNQVPGGLGADVAASLESITCQNTHLRLSWGDICGYRG